MPDNTRPAISVEPGEVVLRGTPIVVRSRAQLHEDSAQGVDVLGQRTRVTLADDLRSVSVDTGQLPAGRHHLRVGDVWERRSGRRLAEDTVEFVVIDSAAPLPDDVVVHQAARMRFAEHDVERLPLDQRGEGSFVEVFKAETRRGRKPVQLAFDEKGREVDLDRELAALTRRRLRRFGKVHPDLDAALERGGEVPVAIWLVEDETEPFEKPTRGQVRRRPKQEAALALRNVEEVRRRAAEYEHEYGLSPRKEIQPAESRATTAPPVVFGRMPADAVRKLARRDEVAAVFLHETEGIDDLDDSIAIANADDAHDIGFTGDGIDVAVYEQGPDDTTNLQIADRFLTNPSTSDHSRHTHGIIKNVEPNQPHGHAPDCNLHSANSYDLDAVQWAADEGCTVISQSFHRPSEQTSSTLSFDDIYKDRLALRWPWPTICEAAGNGPDDEYVNHKGYNRLTVGNHNDTATGMSSTTVFRNPSSGHGDRELPEISANGTGVTAVGLNMSGTSMAAPAVAGAAALVQEVNGTLRSWPEGCRAILMAGAWRNPVGGTWRSDLISGVDGVDGAGALDSKAAVDIARSRASRNGTGRRRGWDVGTVRSADLDGAGYATYVYRVTVPRLLFSPRVKVALAWDSKVTSFTWFGLDIPLSSQLTVDLDLSVRDSSGAVVASSASWDNSYEIAEFAARRGETYEIRIRRWSGSDDVWYGVAWTTTGIDLVVDRLENGGLAALSRG